MSGWPASKSLSFEDFAGHQLELIIMWLLFLVMAIWVYYNAESHFVKGHYTMIFVILTLILGQIGLILYLSLRNKVVR